MGHVTSRQEMDLSAQNGRDVQHCINNNRQHIGKKKTTVLFRFWVRMRQVERIETCLLAGRNEAWK